MPKFFVTQDKISDNQIIIDSEDVTHISRVLRLEKGDNVTVCDGQGTDYDAQIDTIEPKKILLNIVSRQKSETEPNIKVTLFQALPKASKMEYIIQKTKSTVGKRLPNRRRNSREGVLFRQCLNL